MGSYWIEGDDCQLERRGLLPITSTMWPGVIIGRILELAIVELSSTCANTLPLGGK